jgi:hypothetical protein
LASEQTPSFDYLIWIAPRTWKVLAEGRRFMADTSEASLRPQQKT